MGTNQVTTTKNVKHISDMDSILTLTTQSVLFIGHLKIQHETADIYLSRDFNLAYRIY